MLFTFIAASLLPISLNNPEEKSGTYIEMGHPDFDPE